MFERRLQEYYGIERDGQHYHVRRSALSESERRWVVAALRACSKGYAQHADALERETNREYGAAA